MKLYTLFLFVFLISNIYSQQQIPNGNFEDWTNNEADFWNSSFNIGITINTAEQTSDSYQGNYAAKLTSQSFYGQFIPGLITLGDIDLTNMTLTGGIPYIDRPDGINFFFKYTPSDIDTMFFAAFLTHWNNTTSETDTVGMTGYFTADTYDTYTQINLPFVYASQETPDTLNILFTSSGFSGNDGSTLFIDSLSMINGPVISPTFCFPAKDITSSSFTANWMTMPNAESYSLDVSESSDFSSFLTGYENLNTGTDTFYVVNVSPGTYYYRVRVNYTEGTSINSNTVEVTIENTDINNLNNENIKILSNQNIITVSNINSYIENIQVYNIEGELIKDISKKGKNIQINFNSSGIYLLEIKAGNKIIRKKIAVIF